MIVTGTLVSMSKKCERLIIEIESDDLTKYNKEKKNIYKIRNHHITVYQKPWDLIDCQMLLQSKIVAKCKESNIDSLILENITEMGSQELPPYIFQPR